MSLYKRGDLWWYKFRFAGQLVRESAKTESKTLAKDAERLVESLPASRRVLTGSRVVNERNTMHDRFPWGLPLWLLAVPLSSHAAGNQRRLGVNLHQSGLMLHKIGSNLTRESEKLQ